MIKANRLLELLSPQEFQLAWEHWIGRQFHFDFVRETIVNGVFEHIEISSQGKRGEAVSCRIWISPLRGHRVRFKPSPDASELILELCDCMPDRAYTVIECVSDASSWEMRVADIAPQRARNLAKKNALDIADKTACQRNAAQQYVERIRQISDEPVMEYLAYQLRSRATPEQEHEINRLAGLARIPSSDDVNDAIECGAIAIVLFGSAIDADQNAFHAESPTWNRELRMRLDIIADELRRGLPTRHGRRAESPSA
jgi:hypothetical protein